MDAHMRVVFMTRGWRGARGTSSAPGGGRDERRAPRHDATRKEKKDGGANAKPKEKDGGAEAQTRDKDAHLLLLVRRDLGALGVEQRLDHLARAVDALLRLALPREGREGARARQRRGSRATIWGLFRALV